MAGGMSIKGLEELKKNLGNTDDLVQEFEESCARELAARLLSLVIKRTPVGVYPEGSGMVGGTLRRGWTSDSDKQAMYTALFGGGEGSTESKGSQKAVYGKGAVAENARGYANSLEVIKKGDVYTVKVTNPVEYASYVEYGHRQEPGRFVPAIGKRLKAGWVQGQFMLTISEKELQRAAPAIIEKKIAKFLKGVFG